MDDQQPTLDGLEHSVRERAVHVMVQALQGLGIVQSYGDPSAGRREAIGILSYLEEAGGILQDDPSLETVVDGESGVAP